MYHFSLVRKLLRETRGNWHETWSGPLRHFKKLLRVYVYIIVVKYSWRNHVKQTRMDANFRVQTRIRFLLDSYSLTYTGCKWTLIRNRFHEQSQENENVLKSTKVGARICPMDGIKLPDEWVQPKAPIKATGCPKGGECKLFEKCLGCHKRKFQNLLVLLKEGVKNRFFDRESILLESRIK